MVFFVLKGGEYTPRYLRYKQLSHKIVKMSLVDKEFFKHLKILNFSHLFHHLFIFRKPKDLWHTIYRILHPSQKRISANPNILNHHFSTTSQCLLGSSPSLPNDLQNLINTLPDNASQSFNLRPVTFQEVLNELKSLRSDCSTGQDQIPVKYVKLAAEWIASPLAHIINHCIANNSFHCIANNSGLRKGYSTNSVLLQIRDDIIQAMKKGEVMLIAFADFSKAFDTVDYATVLKKLHNVGFSYLQLLLSPSIT